jgi:hypothetical protein
LRFKWNTLCSECGPFFQELQLSPTSTTYALWKDTPVPITLDFFFFNWTNPEELLQENFRPDLVEVGPYRFM